MNSNGPEEVKETSPVIEGRIESMMASPSGTGSWFYRFAWLLVRFLLIVFFRLKVKGAKQVPKEGGVILASNHCSLLDPPVVGVSTWRELNFMAKRELFAGRLLGGLISRLHAFPVRRGFGRDAIKAALDVLAREQALLLFPEGTRSKDGRLGPVKAGLGMLAVVTGKPIVPVCISGTRRLWRSFLGLDRIQVTFGEALLPPQGPVGEDRKALYHRISSEVMERIAQMQAAQKR